MFFKDILFFLTLLNEKLFMMHYLLPNVIITCDENQEKCVFISLIYMYYVKKYTIGENSFCLHFPLIHKKKSI
jgi:hypothetical protein